MPGMDDQYWARTASVPGNGSGGASSAGAGGGTQQSQDMNLVRASKMKGRQVQDKSGDAVGEVRDLIVSVADGKVEHVLVDVKDAGQARIKPDALASGTGDTLVVDMSREQLANQATPAREERQASRSEAGQRPSGQAQRAGG